jgi:flavin reductase (DIM6/NTAB) family NADH-FMN oxidoreductase RutF
LITKRGRFIVHLLPCVKESAAIAEAFSKSDLAPHVTTFQDPFQLARWTFNDKWKFPVMDGVLGAFLCKMDKTVDIGDHQLLIAKVEGIIKGEDDAGGALSYCGRKYRRQGDTIWPHDIEEDE